MAICPHCRKDIDVTLSAYPPLRRSKDIPPVIAHWPDGKTTEHRWDQLRGLSKQIVLSGIVRHCRPILVWPYDPCEVIEDNATRMKVKSALDQAGVDYRFKQADI